MTQTIGVTNIDIKTSDNMAQIYQQLLAAQSDNGPATVKPQRNRFVPGQESLSRGIFYYLLLKGFIVFEHSKLKDELKFNRIS